MESSSLISSLSLIDDHRSDKNKRYPLPLLLLIAFCASISKHDSYTKHDYAQAHEASLRELYKQLFGEELESMSPPPHTTRSIEPCKSSPIRASSEPIRTGALPYFGGTKRRGRSVSMARLCVASRSPALTLSRTSYRPMPLIFSLTSR